jgi:hypothetical protein
MLRSEEHHGLYIPSVIVRTVKPKRVRRDERVARMEENFGFET